MKLKHLFFILIVFQAFKGEEEPSLEIYAQLNNFEMISESQSFIIKTSEPSIAYFDSFDQNSIIYITKDKDKFLSQDDEKITGKFYPIESNVEYYVRNSLYNPLYTSTFKKYLYPTDLTKEKILIGENIKYLYLQKDNTYNLEFKNNKINKMIYLSRKTLNSIIIIKYGEKEEKLSNNSLYYKLEDDFEGELVLEVKENDGFIEFLSNEGDYEILKDVTLLNYEIQKKTTLIKVDNTQKDFLIQLNSDKPFEYSFSYGFSNNENYYYYFNSTPNIISLKEDNSYLVLFKIWTPFKNVNLTDKEFFSFSVNVEKELNQKVILSYKQYSEISELLDERLDEEYCEGIKKYLKDVFEIYVFTDIAKNPPIIDGHPNYHHERIDIQETLENIQTKNRYFYEFYQEVMKILTATKDIHLTIFSYKTPKGIIFEQYIALLPFNFVIKNDTQSREYKIYIKSNNYIQNYEESVRKFIIEHENIPLRNINDQDPFSYIQYWSKFKATKNIHAQFTYIINFNIFAFYLRDHPFNYSDLNLNEYEFEDNKILRIPYNIIKPNINDKEFNEFFHNYIIEQTQAENIHFPFIDEIKYKYLFYKGIKKKLNENKKEEIEWNITIYNDYNQTLKCRVDEENKVNVVL